jgi:hypothetical protein
MAERLRRENRKSEISVKQRVPVNGIAWGNGIAYGEPEPG